MFNICLNKGGEKLNRVDMLQNIQNHFQGSVVESNAKSILNAWLIEIAEYYAHYKLLSAHLRGQKTVKALKNRQSTYINQCQVKEVAAFVRHMENQLEGLLADMDFLNSLSKDSCKEGFNSL